LNKLHKKSKKKVKQAEEGFEVAKGSEDSSFYKRKQARCVIVMH
jgi:hypothetical protein